MKDDIRKRPLLRTVAISNIIIVLLSVFVVSSTPVALACHITTSVTASPSALSTYDWSITKTVTPDKLSIYPGDQGTAQYTVTVTKSAQPVNTYSVTGAFTVENYLDTDMKALKIDVVIQRKAPGSNTWVDASDHFISYPTPQIKNGKTGTYSYTLSLPSAKVQSGYSYQVSAVASDQGYSSTIASAFTIPALTIVNNQVTVTDDKQGSLGTLTQSGVYTYSKVFTAANAGANSNTATIVELRKAATATVTVTVPDKPARTVQFQQADYTVGETAGKVTLTATLSSPALVDVTVKYQTAPGTAIAGTGYTDASGILTFTAGQTVKTFDVTVLNDGSYSDPAKYFYVNLADTTGPAAIGSPAQARVTLTEASDKPSVHFETGTYTVNENDGSVKLTLVMTGKTSDPVTVGYKTVEDTAKAGIDYTGVDSSVTFAPGQTTKDITINVLNDGVYGLSSKDFFVDITGVTGPATKGTPSEAKVILTEGNDKPTLQFGSESYSVAEPSPTASATRDITVTLSGKCDFPVKVDVATSDGTATTSSPNDYDPVTTTLTIPAGQLSATFTVTVYNDGFYSTPDKYFYAELGANDAGLSGEGSHAKVTITETDGAPTISFSSENFNVNEPDSGKAATATVTVTLSEACTFPVTVNYATADGTAKATTDYDAASDAVTIPAGQLSATFDVTVYNDGMYSSPDKYLYVNLGTNSAGFANSLDQATVTIVEVDGVPTVQFKQAAYTVGENGGNAVLYVTLSEPVSDPVKVYYQTNDGTALDGVNYTGITDGIITFPAGSIADQQIKVPILDDEKYGWNTQFTVQLTGVESENAQIGSPDTATVTITENDPYIVHVHYQWTVVSWPINNRTIYASDLTDNATLGVLRVGQWDPVTKNFKTYNKGDPKELFDYKLDMDVGTFIYGSYNDQFPVYGPVMPSHTVTMYPGWNAIGWSSFDTVKASDIVNKYPDVARVAKFNWQTQKFSTFNRGDIEDFDFTFKDEEACLVYSSANSNEDFGIGGVYYI